MNLLPHPPGGSQPVHHVPVVVFLLEPRPHCIAVPPIVGAANQQDARTVVKRVGPTCVWLIVEPNTVSIILYDTHSVQSTFHRAVATGTVVRIQPDHFSGHLVTCSQHKCYLEMDAIGWLRVPYKYFQSVAPESS